ncbi:HicB family protein [Aureimonas sp. SA4125]|uniref:type II toxin-antitoxin system HicB family antitoxin n=1 Tax=Aureimonas sp. SA4125 TaxID=2826993 RepID=UPI001CC6C48B|nr:type II toxin-antitoxin system HicB family antitoxin [Aureimonas sp. SA4125]BDA86653.1 HicB family protein [Aureimonas sp. SA4125]
MTSYIAIIHKDSDSDFGVSFPDFPGCISGGRDLDEARAMAGEALALHLVGMDADGDTIPEPSSLDAVMANAANRDGVAILVTVPERVRKSVRVNVTFPEDTLRAIDMAAEERGLTRSGFLLESAKSAMGRKDSKRPAG